MKTSFILPSFALVFASVAIAGSDAPAKGKEHVPGPCKAIVEACKNAGFIEGDWKKGDGLWLDCVNPVVQHVTNVPGITKSLPTVDQGIIDKCKSKHPKFGMGKIGSLSKDKDKK